MPTGARPRVLLIAESANPEWVSGPLIGWSFSRALREVADVHVVTQVRNQGALERAGWREGREFTAIDSEAVARRLHSAARRLRGGDELGWTLESALSTLSYYYFEHLVWRRFGAAVKGHEFDLVHRITPQSPVVPSPIAARCARAAVPFVLGPVNGGIAWPREFSDLRKRDGDWMSLLRPLHRVLPASSSTRRYASAIVVGSTHCWDQFSPECAAKLFLIPENGIDLQKFATPRMRTAGAPLRAAFVGRLVAVKGVEMLLEAAAPLIRRGELFLDILGDGPERGSLSDLVIRDGLEAGVQWSGWVPHLEVQRHLSEADLFVFPSIRDFGGGAVLEAMAVGTPPLVVRYGGPADLVDEEVGFLVEMGSRQEIVARLRETLIRLRDNPASIDERGRAARARVERWYTWNRKAEQMREIYDWVLGRRRSPCGLSRNSRGPTRAW